jgi:hypothetical protein
MFSVVIPTRARADTLRHALRTAVAQPEPDLEIVVHESGDDPATAAVIAEFDDRRIRAFKTGEPVLMTENWERALRCTTGKYVIFIGDDDGLMPHACTIVRKILSKRPTELISSNYALYLWPDYFDQRIRDRLFARYTGDLACMVRNSRTALYLTYQFRRPGSELPMIYHSFVGRSLIERVYKSRGSYFFVAGGPDVVSGIVNLCFSDEFICCDCPLSVYGMSRHSGNAQIVFSGNSELRTAAIGSGVGNVRVHPTMVPSYNSVICIANELLLIKDELFPGSSPKLDYAAMLQQALQSLNEKPDQYDLELAQCRTIAEKNHITIDDESVAPGRPKPALPPLGRHQIAPGVVAHSLDGLSAGVQNVFDATTVFNELLPKPTNNAVKITFEPGQVQAIALTSGSPTELDLSASGNGAILLGGGWSTAEPWGVWSIALSSELTLPVMGYVRGQLRITVQGQILCPPRTLRTRIQQGSAALIERELSLTNEAFTFDLFPIELRKEKPAEELQVVFSVDRCISPFELGLSEDRRKLGFGLRRIEIAVVGDLAEG